MGWSLRSCHGNLARLLPSIAALQTGRRFRHGLAHPQGVLCFTSQFSRSTGGTDEAVIGSMGSHKRSLWHCNVGRHPAGLCAFVGHFHLCSLSWQLVTCQHCPNPCCTLRADRQQRAQLAAGPPFPGEGTFPSVSVWPTLLLQQNLCNWAIHLKKKKACIFSVSEEVQHCLCSVSQSLSEAKSAVF